MIKGRNCSVEYLLNKEWINNILEVENKTIYIVGGLYGNIESLKEIKKIAEKEKEYPLIIFNGDIHWFDIYEKDFLLIEEIIKNDIKLLGNVEYELINKNSKLGCGCNYPDEVDENIVKRSNIIHSKMKKNINNNFILEKIKKRNKTLVLNFHNNKLGITHGDEKNLAGWGCSYDNLSKIAREQELKSWFIKNNVDVLLTTHTCLPAVKKINTSYIFNNGASGMGNIKNKSSGLFTRISLEKSKNHLISINKNNIFIELIEINFNLKKFINWFDNIWPLGSEASISYRNRIINGTNLEEKDIYID